MPLILFNKPFQVMSQFSAHPERQTLADFIPLPCLPGWPARRRQRGPAAAHRRRQAAACHNPRRKQPKTYLAQVDGLASPEALERLRKPLDLGDFDPELEAKLIQEPAWLWPRTPPIRQRLNQPTSWIALTISEGKNRQVRRMTAAVGLPTLRLVRIAIGPFSLATHPLLGSGRKWTHWIWKVG
jgi:23S rRNA pseudouridine2457 synthase